MRTQIKKIRNKRRNLRYLRNAKTKNKRECYERLYANKFDNLEEMDNFLETYNPLKLNEETTDSLNRLITRNDVESVTTTKKNFLQTKIQDQMASHKKKFAKFYQTSKELTPIFLKIFQKTEEKGAFFETLYEATIT